MSISFGAKSFRHIVDVDGQLHGIEVPRIGVAALLALAGRGAGDDLFRVDQETATLLDPSSSVSLSEHEVAFFESSRALPASEMRLAA